MIEDYKEGVTAEGLHPFMYAVRLVVYGVTIAVAGRRPIITGARNDRLGEIDDPTTWHDNGLALDLRGNDLDADTRQRYAAALRAALAPLGCDVVGPYALPRGHVHVELDPRRLAEAVTWGLAAVAVLAIL